MVPGIRQDKKVSVRNVFGDGSKPIKSMLGSSMLKLDARQDTRFMTSRYTPIVVHIDHKHVIDFTGRSNDEMPGDKVTNGGWHLGFLVGSVQLCHGLDRLEKVLANKLWSFIGSQGHTRPNYHEDSNTIRSFAPRKWG